LARTRSHQEVDGEHLFLALVDQSDSLIPQVLQKLGVPMPKLKADLEAELGRRHTVQGVSSSDAYLSQTLKRALDAATDSAAKLKDEYISTEHLLLGLIETASPSLKKILQGVSLKRDDVLKALMELRG